MLQPQRKGALYTAAFYRPHWERSLAVPVTEFSGTAWDIASLLPSHLLDSIPKTSAWDSGPNSPYLHSFETGPKLSLAFGQVFHSAINGDRQRPKPQVQGP